MPLSRFFELRSCICPDPSSLSVDDAVSLQTSASQTFPTAKAARTAAEQEALEHDWTITWQQSCSKDGLRTWTGRPNREDGSVWVVREQQVTTELTGDETPMVFVVRWAYPDCLRDDGDIVEESLEPGTVYRSLSAAMDAVMADLREQADEVNEENKADGQPPIDVPDMRIWQHPAEGAEHPVWVLEFEPLDVLVRITRVPLMG